MNYSRRPRLLKDYPAGTVSVQEFAVRHGVAEALLRHHITEGIDDEHVEATPIRFGLDGRRTYHYLPPEQQSQCLAFWDKHKIPYRTR